MINTPIPEILLNKYHIINILGQGGVGVTYRAIEIETDRIVAIKSLSLKRAKDWKAIELFDREAKILSQLDHPAIPAYIDHFQVDTEIDRQYYIVQTLAEGESLFDAVASGWKPTIDEAKDIAVQVLNILTYLHDLNPPVIHRDIKPQNLIRNAEGKNLSRRFWSRSRYLLYRHWWQYGSRDLWLYGSRTISRTGVFIHRFIWTGNDLNISINWYQSSGITAEKIKD